MAAARARPRLSLGTYQSPKSPIASPAAQVHTHQRWPAGMLPRTMSSTTSATAHPAVMTWMTSWSFASSGGGRAGVNGVLEGANLVLRSPHPTDRRQVILTVTGEGRTVVQRVRRRKDAWLARRLAELTADERAALRAAVPILEKLSQSS